MDDVAYMQMALVEARQAETHGDVPIGAIAVLNGRIIGRGHNRRELDRDPTAHAEMIAMREAAHAIQHWRLDNVTLYCTLEPCAMCAGAMVIARLPRLVFAVADAKAGASSSVIDLLNHPRLNHHVQVEQGLLAEEAAELLLNFFAKLRTSGKRR